MQSVERQAPYRAKRATWRGVNGWMTEGPTRFLRDPPDVLPTELEAYTRVHIGDALGHTDYFQHGAKLVDGVYVGVRWNGQPLRSRPETIIWDWNEYGSAAI